MTDRARISFGRVGPLPSPEGLPAPRLFVLSPFAAGGSGSLTFPPDEKGRPVGYSFAPLGADWQDWQASDGYEDCEVGGGEISATGPDGKRYSWKVLFLHDGNPAWEFWGAVFEPPTLP